MAKPNVAVIIPNYNGRVLLERHVPSLLRAAANVGARVVVADDGSTDESVAWLKQAHPEVEVLAYAPNSGFAHNCNRAIKETGCDVVVLVNSDVEVEDDFIVPLLEPFCESDDVFAVSPRILDAAREGGDEAINYFEFKHGMIRVRYPCVFDGRQPPSRRAPIGYACGAAAAIDRNKFIELGGFDRLYEPFYWEDADLGYRAWKRGWKIIYEPASAVRHQLRGTIGSLLCPGRLNRVQTQRAFWFNWKNLSERGLILRHLLWLLRFPAGFIYHRQWPELAGLILAPLRLHRCVCARKGNPAMLGDHEIMQRARPWPPGI